MPKPSVLPATRWVLENRAYLDRIAKLTRIPDELEFMKFVSNPGYQLFVPRGFLAYEIIAQIRKPEEIERFLFFALKESEGPQAQAYLFSVVRVRQVFDMSDTRQDLTRSPWFDVPDTNYIFNRLLTTAGHALFNRRCPNARDSCPLFQ